MNEKNSPVPGILEEQGFSYEDILSMDTLGYYDILTNEEEEVLIVFPKKEMGTRDQAKFYYDGGAHGILQKNKDGFLICDFIHPGVREAITKQKKVFIGEVDKNASSTENLEEYEATVIFCRGLERVLEQVLSQRDEE